MMGLVATVLLQLPFFKHMFAWMGCQPAGNPPFCNLACNLPLEVSS
jgi:hypothetical protein